MTTDDLRAATDALSETNEKLAAKLAEVRGMVGHTDEPPLPTVPLWHGMGRMSEAEPPDDLADFTRCPLCPSLVPPTATDGDGRHLRTLGAIACAECSAEVMTAIEEARAADQLLGQVGWAGWLRALRGSR